MATDCIENVIKDLKGMLSVEEVEKVYNRIATRFNNPKWDPKIKAELEKPVTPGELAAYEEKLKSLSPEGRLQEAARRAFEDALHDKKEQLRREYENTERLNAALKTIQQHGATDAGKGKQIGYVNALVHLLSGDPRGKQNFLSMEARKNGILQVDLADMYTALEKYQSVWGFKMDNEQILNIAKEMDKAGSSGDPHAKALVETWSALAERNRKRLNELGADIAYRKDWRLPQAWDAQETKRYGLYSKQRRELLTASPERKQQLYDEARDKWIDEAMQRVDRSQYVDADGFELNDYSLREVLAEIHRTISTEGLSAAPRITQGKAGLAQSLGASRELHFKSAEDWLLFNQKSGQFDPLGPMLNHIHQNARDIAVVQTFGPDAARNFETALHWARFWDSGKTDPDTINKTAFHAENIFDEVSGLNGIKGDGFFSNFMSGFRNWMVATKLGGVLLSQVSDLSTYSTIARTDGLGMGDAIRFATKSLSAMSKEDKRIAAWNGIASHAVVNDVSTRVGESVKGVGWTNKAANFTIIAGGMKWWTDAMQRGYQMLIGFSLANAKGRAFNDLEPLMASMLKRYGIDEAEWSIIRRAEPVEVSGEKMISPVSVRLLGEREGIDTGELAVKVAALMHDESMIAVATPGAAQRAWLAEHTPSGTKSGELMRSFALFHTFTLSMSQRVLPRIMHAEGTSGFRAGLMTQFVLGGLIAGAFSVEMKEISKGRNPRDVTDPEFWLAAAAQGIGVGIFGDFVFQDVNRFGGGPTNTLAGPIWGSVDDFSKLTIGNIHSKIKGKDAHFWADLIQFGKNQAPVINLFYTRIILDHLLLYQAQEAANPGYLRRMQSRLRNEQRQTLWWNPRDMVPNQGPDFVYMLGGR